jgi:hypothetical protein
MKKIDARTLNQDVKEAQRLQIVCLRESGRSNKKTSEINGIRREKRISMDDKAYRRQRSTAELAPNV